MYQEALNGVPYSGYRNLDQQTPYLRSQLLELVQRVGFVPSYSKHNGLETVQEGI